MSQDPGAANTYSRDLAYARAVMTWALEHLDEIDLTHAQRRAVERELGRALELRSRIIGRRGAAVPPLG